MPLAAQSLPPVFSESTKGYGILRAESFKGMMNASSLAGRPFFFAVDYEMTRGIFIPGDSIAESPVKFRFPSFWNAGKRAFPRQDCRMMAFPEPFRSYEKKFEKVARAILRGDTYLANLTVRTPVSISASLEDIFNFSGSEFAMLAPRELCLLFPGALCAHRRRHDIFVSYERHDRGGRSRSRKNPDG